MHEIKRVVIIGLGALGIMYGHFFEKKLGKENVLFLANSERVHRYQKSVFKFNNEVCHFQYACPENISFQADLLMFAVKGGALKDAIELAKSVVSDQTIIISVLNGISSEEIISNGLDKGHVIPCFAQKMDALKEGCNVTSKTFGELCIGLLPNSCHDEPFLHNLMNFFDSIGFSYQHKKDIRHGIWCKWMLNVGVNQVLMVENGTFDDIQKSGPKRERMLSAMREVLELSKLEGVFLTEEDFDQYVNIIDHLNSDGMPSMRQDRLARRASEVELFSGTVIRKAKQFGLLVPTNLALYEEIKQIESTY